MATAFHRTRRGITASLAPGERRIIARTMTDVSGMLTEGLPEGGESEGGEPGGTGVSDADLEALVGLSPEADRPVDPALARLLPDGTRDDDAAAREFRRLTERDLREQKSTRIRTVLLTLGRSDPLVLAPPEAEAWVVALTDVRLVLGSRLGLETDEDAEALTERLARVGRTEDSDDPEIFLAQVYDFLTWLQESLVEALLTEH